jgi:hypothetical protein
MAAIYKWTLQPLGQTELFMPANAQVLTVQIQDGNPQMWVKLDPTQPMISRMFYVYGTGHHIPDDPRLIYIATFQMDPFVFHVFEK